MTSSLINTTRNAAKTNSEAVIDIPIDVEEEENHWHEFTLIERNSLLTNLNRIYIYWRQFVFKKLRLVFTLAFVTVSNFLTRLQRFTRRPTTTDLSAITESPLSPISQKYSNRIDFLSPDDLSMTHILLQQQSQPINLHQSSSMEEKDLSPSTPTMENRMFFYSPDSERFRQFIEQLTLDPHSQKYQTTSNDFIKKNLSLALAKSEESSHCDTKNQTSDPIIPTVIVEEVDEDLSSQNNANVNTDRSTRRRKRRSSLTKTSSNDQTEPLIPDSTDKIDTTTNTSSTSQANEDTQSTPIETLSIQDSNENAILSNSTRGRRSRYRVYRQTVPTPVESTLSTPPPSPSLSSPPSSPSLSSPPSSPSNTSPTRTGGLKRSSSFGTAKKVVRFADSVGRELAQVQYIQSLTDEDGSFGKNDLYLPQTSPLEHKPWSFDVTLPLKQFSPTPIPRRFFCLYRQPNSEHPDIYLHEIWKSQIKLEHADVRLKSSETGEQYLYGTLWVTNASYWKNVTLKYTFNHWINSYESECQHRCHSNDFRNIDQFQFTIDIPHDVDRIEFVLRYRVNGQEFWDNNNGQNYTIETDSASIPSTQISLPHDCDFNEMRFY